MFTNLFPLASHYIQKWDLAEFMQLNKALLASSEDLIFCPLENGIASQELKKDFYKLVKKGQCLIFKKKGEPFQMGPFKHTYWVDTKSKKLLQAPPPCKDYDPNVSTANRGATGVDGRVLALRDIEGNIFALKQIKLDPFMKRKMKNECYHYGRNSQLIGLNENAASIQRELASASETASLKISAKGKKSYLLVNHCGDTDLITYILSLRDIYQNYSTHWLQNYKKEIVLNFINICSQLVEKVEDLHLAGLTHGDIKPDNIGCQFLPLVEDGPINPIEIHLLDFARASTIIEVIQPGRAPGTDRYLPGFQEKNNNWETQLEYLRGLFSEHHVTAQDIDVYAVHASIRTILTTFAELTEQALPLEDINLLSSVLASSEDFEAHLPRHGDETKLPFWASKFSLENLASILSHLEKNLHFSIACEKDGIHPLTSRLIPTIQSSLIKPEAKEWNHQECQYITTLFEVETAAKLSTTNRKRQSTHCADISSYPLSKQRISASTDTHTSVDSPSLNTL